MYYELCLYPPTLHSHCIVMPRYRMTNGAPCETKEAENYLDFLGQDENSNRLLELSHFTQDLLQSDDFILIFKPS